MVSWRRPQARGSVCRETQVGFLVPHSSFRTSCLLALGTGDLVGGLFAWIYLCTSPGKSSWVEEWLGAVSRDGLGLVEEDRVKKEASGKDEEGCQTGTGGVHLEKEADVEHLKETAPFLEVQQSRSVPGIQRCLLSPWPPSGPHQCGILSFRKQRNFQRNQICALAPNPMNMRVAQQSFELEQQNADESHEVSRAGSSHLLCSSG